MKAVAAIIAAGLMTSVACMIAVAENSAPATAPATQPSAAVPLAQDAPAKSEYALAKTFDIGGPNLWCNITVDAEGQRLYVARLDRIQVIDAATGKLLAEIGPCSGARAVILVPQVGRGFISNCWGGFITVFDLKTNAVLGKVPVGAGCDGIAYDPISKRILVCCWTDLTLESLPADADVHAMKPDAVLKFDGAPEHLVVDGQGTAFVTANLVGKGQIEVIDTRQMKVITTWPLPAGGTVITMDRLHSRLFAGCGLGVVAFSAADGHEFAEISAKTRASVDGLGIDGAAYFDGNTFASSADGTLTIIGQSPQGTFEVRQRLAAGYWGAGNANNKIAVNPKNGDLYVPVSEARNGENQRRIPGPFKILVYEKK